MNRPLRGLRVLELGTYVAAPALGSFLGMLGARVTKVEPPDGDPTRKLTPWSWVSYNWNKRLLTLDLKSETGREELARLLKRTDILVESLSPRAVRELGLGFAKVRALNKKIIYCSIKGFARGSSSANRVGFDTIAQAEGGLMHVARRESGRPSRVGNPCVDLSAASFGAIGILSALLSRPKKAAFVEIPLKDVVVYWNGYWLPYIDFKGGEPSNLGSSHPGFAPYGVFSTRDGFVFIGVLADSHWQKLAAKLRISSGPSYQTMQQRIAAREKVDALVQSAVRGLGTERLLALLGDDVPCARVATLMDLHSDRDLRRRGVIRSVSVGRRRFSVAVPPFPRSARPMKVKL